MIVLILFTGCAKGQNQKKETLDDNFDETIAGSFSTQTQRKFDSTQVADFFKKYPLLKEYEKDVKAFYKQRLYAYAWFDKEGFTEQADHLYFRVTNLHKNGKRDSTLYHADLEKTIEENNIDEKTAPFVDIMLTAQYLHYSKRNFEGKVSAERARAMNWLIPRKKVDALQLLTETINDDKDVFENSPLRKQYNELRKQLQFIRQKGLDTVTAIKGAQQVYRDGDSSDAMAKVRQRLVLWGDIKQSNQSAILDEQLHDGIRSFQKRNGLKVDGIAGPGFFNALNVSGKERIEQILLNMERVRWLPRYTEGEHLLVNIPAYKLYAFNGDSLVSDRDVIVGEDLRKTVIFSDEIAYMDFSPYWYIPPGIMRRTVLPAIRRNSNYLARNNMERIGGTAANPQIRQRPGGTNPMGKVKFMFPNTFNIYLHDTPNKELFDRPQRAFSAGCVRVSDAEFLANFLLKEQPEWDKQKINAAMNASRERRVHLKKKMPVYLTYLTAYVDKEGKLNFRKDIYNRDRALAEQLFR